MIGYEQTCRDCGTREAAGSYCTKCYGRNIERYRAGRGRPRSATGGGPKNPLSATETAAAPGDAK